MRARNRPRQAGAGVIKWRGDPALDPRHPTAYPLEGATALFGEMPVRLRAEGTTLVGYGFGRQRVEIPAGSIGKVVIHPEYETLQGATMRPGLLVLDKTHHVLLKVPGDWPRGPVGDLCGHLGLRNKVDVIGAVTAGRELSLLRAAAGYRRLRVRPRGYRVREAVAQVTPWVATMAGFVAGMLAPLALPASVGDARDLLSILLAAAGLPIGRWLPEYAARSSLAALRWAAASRRAGSLAPVNRFFPVDVTDKWVDWLITVALGVTAPVLAVWGLVISCVAAAHGYQGVQAGTVAAGAVAILAAPPLGWLFLRRVWAQRSRLRDEFTKDFA
jgi:hypothetical protein